MKATSRFDHRQEYTRPACGVSEQEATAIVEALIDKDWNSISEALAVIVNAAKTVNGVAFGAYMLARKTERARFATMIGKQALSKLDA